MIKYLSSVLIVTSSFVIAIGQTPEVKVEKEKVFAFAFEGGGGYLGVQTQEINKENFAKFGLSSVRGVAVEKVSEGSPAAAAEIKEGDVIIRFNGEEITSTRKLTRLISEVAPDHQARVTILRGGSESELTATMGKRQMPRMGDGNWTFSTPPTPPMPRIERMPRGDAPRVFSIPEGEGRSFMWRGGEGRQIGISGYAVTKQLGERYGIDGGVLINNVRDNSPAAKAGLKAGDIIVEVDGKAVKGDLDLIRAINAKKEGDISLTYIRDGKRQTINITPEASKGSGFVFETEDNG